MTIRRFFLLFVLIFLIVGAMLGGVFVGSYATHFVWALLADAPVRSAAEAPAWLVIPTFAIATALFVLVNRCTRLIERFLRACHR